jgi:D-xylose 1-dehydrogenase (NADP+, D-xylono-1,5-lactone-forming)
MGDAGATGAVRFGCSGAGWIAGRALAPAVHAADGAVLQAVASRDADRAASLEPAGRSYGGPGSYDAMLADPDVDVVYINLSNEGHRPWSLAALRAGKHVLCEKPLGMDGAEVSSMIEAASRAGRLLVEAFWYRWHPRTRRLEELLAAGGLGPVRDLEADFSFDGRTEERMAGNYRLELPRGGGALYDVGCYSVSASHTVLGPVLSVLDAQSLVGPTGVDLATAAHLRADGGLYPGATATALCGIAIPDRQVLRVVGEAASAEFVGEQQSSGEAFTSRQTPSTMLITTPDGSVREEQFAPTDPYRLMVEAVANRVRGEEAFLVGPEHSTQVATTLEAIRAATAPASA